MRTIDRGAPWAAIIGMVLTATTGHAALSTTSISYDTTIAGADGNAHSVSFQGTAAGPALDGTVTVDGEPRAVSGTIAKDGSVSGRLSSPDGKQVGVFWGQRIGTTLKGSFDLGGQTGDWSVPASKLPVPK